MNIGKYRENLQSEKIVFIDSLTKRQRNVLDVEKFNIHDCERRKFSCQQCHYNFKFDRFVISRRCVQVRIL